MGTCDGTQRFSDVNDSGSPNSSDAESIAGFPASQPLAAQYQSGGRADCVPRLRDPPLRGLSLPRTKIKQDAVANMGNTSPRQPWKRQRVESPIRQASGQTPPKPILSPTDGVGKRPRRNLNKDIARADNDEVDPEALKVLNNFHRGSVNSRVGKKVAQLQGAITRSRLQGLLQPSLLPIKPLDARDQIPPKRTLSLPRNAEDTSQDDRAARGEAEHEEPAEQEDSAGRSQEALAEELSENGSRDLGHAEVVSKKQVRVRNTEVGENANEHLHNEEEGIESKDRSDHGMGEYHGYDKHANQGPVAAEDEENVDRDGEDMDIQVDLDAYILPSPQVRARVPDREPRLDGASAKDWGHTKISKGLAGPYAERADLVSSRGQSEQIENQLENDATGAAAHAGSVRAGEAQEGGASKRSVTGRHTCPEASTVSRPRFSSTHVAARSDRRQDVSETNPVLQRRTVNALSNKTENHHAGDKGPPQVTYRDERTLKALDNGKRNGTASSIYAVNQTHSTSDDDNRTGNPVDFFRPDRSRGSHRPPRIEKAAPDELLISSLSPSPYVPSRLGSTTSVDEQRAKESGHDASVQDQGAAVVAQKDHSPVVLTMNDDPVSTSLPSKHVQKMLLLMGRSGFANVKDWKNKIFPSPRQASDQRDGAFEDLSISTELGRRCIMHLHILRTKFQSCPKFPFLADQSEWLHARQDEHRKGLKELGKHLTKITRRLQPVEDTDSTATSYLEEQRAYILDVYSFVIPALVVLQHDLFCLGASCEETEASRAFWKDSDLTERVLLYMLQVTEWIQTLEQAAKRAFEQRRQRNGSSLSGVRRDMKSMQNRQAVRRHCIDLHAMLLSATDKLAEQARRKVQQKGIIDREGQMKKAQQEKEDERLGKLNARYAMMCQSTQQLKDSREDGRFRFLENRQASSDWAGTMQGTEARVVSSANTTRTGPQPNQHTGAGPTTPREDLRYLLKQLQRNERQPRREDILVWAEVLGYSGERARAIVEGLQRATIVRCKKDGVKPPVWAFS